MFGTAISSLSAIDVVIPPWSQTSDAQGGAPAVSPAELQGKQPRRVPLPPEEGEETGDDRDEQEHTCSQNSSGA